MNKRQTRTSKSAIKAHWFTKLKKAGKIKTISRKDFLTRDYCFACLRTDNPVDRAHIVPHNQRGPDSPENLHLLCRACHHQSEPYTGEVYWRWLIEQTAIHSLLHDITRYSGISTQNIFNLLMRERLEFVAQKFGYEFDFDDTERTADWVAYIKLLSKNLELSMGKEKFKEFVFE